MCVCALGTVDDDLDGDDDEMFCDKGGAEINFMHTGRDRFMLEYDDVDDEDERIGDADDAEIRYC